MGCIALASASSEGGVGRLTTSTTQSCRQELSRPRAADDHGNVASAQSLLALLADCDNTPSYPCHSELHIRVGSWESQSGMQGWHGQALCCSRGPGQAVPWLAAHADVEEPLLHAFHLGVLPS